MLYATLSLSGTVLGPTSHCLGLCWVLPLIVWDCIGSYLSLSGTVLGPTCDGNGRNINVTAPIVLKTAMRFWNGDGHNAAIVLYTPDGHAVVLDATLCLPFRPLLCSDIVMNVMLTLSMLS